MQRLEKFFGKVNQGILIQYEVFYNNSWVGKFYFINMYSDEVFIKFLNEIKQLEFIKFKIKNKIYTKQELINKLKSLT